LPPITYGIIIDFINRAFKKSGIFCRIVFYYAGNWRHSSWCRSGKNAPQILYNVCSVIKENYQCDFGGGFID
jgi:hypothetical protein